MHYTCIYYVVNVFIIIQKIAILDKCNLYLTFYSSNNPV